jgi:AcrR family transcriptional regulator
MLGNRQDERPGGVVPDRRAARREATRAEILDAAWALVRENGLGALALRDLAARVGMRAPSLYQYFESKHAIYDAMFGQGAATFEADMAEPFNSDDPAEMLLARARRFVEFCTADVARYQLLFQHLIPGFEPSAESYAPAVRALDDTRELLALNGFTDPRQLDMWTALLNGIADQQTSNDPGGDRWIRLIDDFVTMFSNHCRKQRPSRTRQPARSRTKGTQR